MICSASLAPSASGTLRTLALAIACLGFAAGARADPCHAIADNGALPEYLAPGASFSGPVVYVGDGDSLCVGVGPARSEWVEVRLADFYAPELSSSDGPAAKRALEALAMGREVSCVAQHQSYDRIVARCELDGRSLGDLLRTGGGAEGGNGFAATEAPIAPQNADRAPTTLARPSDQTGAWMLPAAAICAAAAVAVLYVGLRPSRSPRRSRRRRGGDVHRLR